MARRSKPWAVVLTTPGEPVRTEHRSKPEAYRRVNLIRTQALTGVRDVTRIRVEQWEPDYDRWSLYELALSALLAPPEPVRLGPRSVFGSGLNRPHSGSLTLVSGGASSGRD